MLVDHLDPSSYMISIDGGTATVGLCLFTYRHGQMEVIESKLIDVNRMDHHYDLYEHRHPALSIRLRAIKNTLSDWLDQLDYPISLCVYESHFINPRRPTSVIPLARFMQLVDDLMMDRGVAIDTVAPQQMKRAIAVTGKLSQADKGKVKDAIQKKIDDGVIYMAEGKELDELSEHEIDAIGIGYTKLWLDALL